MKVGRYSDDFLDMMSLKLQEVTFGPGIDIYNQNEYSSKYYILAEGSLEVYLKCKNGQKGKERIISNLTG